MFSDLHSPGLYRSLAVNSNLIPREKLSKPKPSSGSNSSENCS